MLCCIYIYTNLSIFNSCSLNTYWLTKQYLPALPRRGRPRLGIGWPEEADLELQLIFATGLNLKNWGCWTLMATNVKDISFRLWIEKSGWWDCCLDVQHEREISWRHTVWWFFVIVWVLATLPRSFHNAMCPVIVCAWMSIPRSASYRQLQGHKQSLSEQFDRILWGQSPKSQPLDNSQHKLVRLI